MSNKELKTRIQMKNDTADNWATASTNGFIPKLGEPIFYREPDSTGWKLSMKVGDGVRTPEALPDFDILIDYNQIAFDTTEIVVGTDTASAIE